MLNQLSQEQDETIGNNEGTDLEPDFHEEPGEVTESPEPQRKTFPEPFVPQLPPAVQSKTHRESSKVSNAVLEVPRQVSSKRIIFVDDSPAQKLQSVSLFTLSDVLTFFDQLPGEQKHQFKAETLGMVATYKKQLKVGHTPSQMPNLLAFLDDDLSELTASDLLEALELAFLELMRNSLSREVYAYFMNHKHLFADCLEGFAATGNPKSMVVSLKKKCQMLVFHGQAPASIAASVVNPLTQLGLAQEHRHRLMKKNTDSGQYSLVGSSPVGGAHRLKAAAPRDAEFSSYPGSIIMDVGLLLVLDS